MTTNSLYVRSKFDQHLEASSRPALKKGRTVTARSKIFLHPTSTRRVVRRRLGTLAINFIASVILSMWRRNETKYEHYRMGEPPHFEAGLPALSWLDTFASKQLQKSGDHVSTKHLEETFHWLWNPAWCDAISVDVEGIRQLKSAVRNADSIVQSLDAFFQCAKDRLGRLQSRLQTISSQTYFHLRTDDILAVIFELASLPNTQAAERECDYKTASISLVSSRFRNIALRVPRLWRFIHTGQTSKDVKLFISRSAGAGPVLEIRMESEGKEEWMRICDKLLTRAGRDVGFASRITYLRFDFRRKRDYHHAEEFVEDHKNLSFPSLHELIINYDYGRTADDVQFCKNWQLPALKVIGARNVLPVVRKEVLAGITECSLHFEDYDDNHDTCWEYKEVLEFIDSLSALKHLDMTLDGNAFDNDAENERCPSFPPKRSIEHLRLALPRTDACYLRCFFDAFGFTTPEKKSWTLEIDAYDDDESLLEAIFPQVHTASDNNNEAYQNLKEFNLILRSDLEAESDQVDCELLRMIPRHAKSLEKFSVSYITAQSRRFEFRNCEGSGDLIEFV